MSQTECPCGSDKEYSDCCQLLHDGKARADSPRALMQARYSAFVKKQVSFLWDTLHADHEARAHSREEFLRSLEEGLESMRYEGLEVMETAEPDRDGAAKVLFSVDVRNYETDFGFVELSYFVDDGDGWRYLMGQQLEHRKLSLPRSSITIQTLPTLFNSSRAAIRKARTSGPVGMPMQTPSPRGTTPSKRKGSRKGKRRAGRRRL